METKHPARQLTRIRAAIRSHPWAITEESLELICAIAEKHHQGLIDDEFVSAAFDKDRKPVVAEPADKPYTVNDGIVVLSVTGPIFPRANMMTRFSGATSLADFISKFTLALADEDVHTIINSYESPGGSVMGIFEAADEIYQARLNSTKRIISHASQACSAAYLLFAQADEGYCSVGAVMGSIGVIAQIDSDARQAANEGVDRTVIRSSELKAPGGDQITPNQLQSLKTMVDSYYGLFKDYVDRARNLDIKQVSTGQTWVGGKALELGLVDGIKSLPQLISELSQVVAT